MGNDKEKLCNLLREFGVGYTIKGNDIWCETGEQKIEGYTGFTTVFVFDSNGRFMKMEIAE